MRSELAIYAAMTAGAIVVLLAKAPSDWPLGIALLLVFFGATGGVMFFKIRALQQVQLAGTLRDSLTRMIGILNSWMTSYMIVYMVVIGSSGAVVLGILARKWGLGPLWWLAAAAFVLGVRGATPADASICGANSRDIARTSAGARRPGGCVSRISIRYCVV